MVSQSPFSAPFAGARRPETVSPRSASEQSAVTPCKRQNAQRKALNCAPEKRRDALRNGSHGQRFSRPIRRSISHTRTGFPRRSAVRGRAARERFHRALRLRTKRSDPLQKAKCTEKSAELRPRKAPRRAPKRQSWAALQQADSPQPFPHAPRFSAPARSSAGSCSLSRRRAPPERERMTAFFHFIRECRPSPERMNARLPALKRVFSPLEYKKRPPEIALRRVDERNVSRAASDRSLAVPPERLPRFRSALA